MDIIIVSIIIAAAALYIGNMFYKKFKAARSGEDGCTCSSCPGGGCCSAGMAKKNYELKNGFV